MTARRRRVRGLRASVTWAFALGALTLSSVLALGTYFSARHFLVDQRERAATRQAFADAALMREGLRTTGAEVSDVLGSIAPPAGAVIFVRRDGEWYSTALDAEGPELTQDVQRIVAEGSVGVSWSEATDPHAVVVGVPLPAVDAEYYEVSVATELDQTLWTLGLALAVGAGLTTAAGALLGRAASRRLLAPLGDVTAAAVQVSTGDLDTRLAATEDPDLAALVGAFNHMVDALHERIDRDARFAADVSHELRTPVTTLTTSLSLLQDTTDLSPRSATAVGLMADELARFRVALDDLLALGRLDAGAHEATPSVIEMDDLVAQTLRAADKPADLLRIERESDGCAGMTVEVDRLQMRRALLNLIRNADVHGGGLVGVGVISRSSVVDVLVEDCGPGVPPADRQRIFERFARAGGQKAGTGSGLGLSIVSRTVHNHGGEVWCEDRSEAGMSFVIRLPRAGTS